MAEPHEAAYRAARYRIDIGGRWIERRIGVVDASADSLLAAAGCRTCWSMVTPCNPGSLPLPATENNRRLDDFLRQIAVAGWRSLPAINVAANGDWLERGRCLLDIDAAALDSLATTWGQRARVDGRLGAAPCLVWTAR